MTNEVRLIDAVKYRETLEEEIAFSEENGKEERVHGLEIAIADLMDAPTVDPETLRPKGRWVCIKDQCNESPVYKCSECSQEVEIHDGRNIQKSLKYCPNCGAKMEV